MTHAFRRPIPYNPGPSTHHTCALSREHQTGCDPMAWFIDTQGHTLPTQQARGLTPRELTQLARIDPALARDYAAGTCPTCNLNRNGTMHQETCMNQREHQPVTTAKVTAIQPWQPRPSRRNAA